VYFCHSPEIWRDFPDLVAGVLSTEGIAYSTLVNPQMLKYASIAESRLAANSESELPEVQAWRRVFSRMGLKPTQYRCASESLLRRFRKERSLPQIHPLIDLCNSISVAFAIPIAAFDLSKISDHLEVRYANGSEIYSTFSGEVEYPEPHEVIFADGDGRAHARPWTSRQSRYSAIQSQSTAVLVVAEAVHNSAQADVEKLLGVIEGELRAAWSVSPKADS
jgi:DNA/RNA-binding domain of Phe-tRNA-synthetase-like protein